jgi:hypothetical protein
MTCENLDAAKERGEKVDALLEEELRDRKEQWR